MPKFSLCVLFALLLIYSSYFGSSNGKIWEPCPLDWIKYSDEKCFKIVDDTLRTFDEAKDACAAQEHTSTLASIHSRDEQNFLTNYLFKVKQKVDNFWIGATVVNENPTIQYGTYVWIHDNSELHYTNWDTIPRNRTNYCVHIQSDEAMMGKWKDGKCFKKNAVVCQRMQFWSLEFMQKTFLASRREQRIALENANHKVEELKLNLIPIGFVYTQLPNAKPPTELWPWMVWTDVSSAYAGTFFRVEGGGSEAFGTEQPENVPRITHVQNDGINCYNDGTIETVVGNWSRMIYSGDFGNGKICLRFKMTGGEVRPNNMAVRVWKRTG